MSGEQFTRYVQAILSVVIIIGGVFAVVTGSPYKQELTTLVSAVLAFWFGVSTPTNFKDKEPTP